MGIHSELSNRASSKRTRSRHSMARRRINKRMNKGHVGRVKGEVAYPELATAGIIRKRRQNSRTNVTLSGKKKRKILKQIKHMQKEKSKMEAEDSSPKAQKIRDVEMVEMSKKKKKPKHNRVEQDTDVQMEEDT